MGYEVYQRPKPWRRRGAVPSVSISARGVVTLSADATDWLGCPQAVEFLIGGDEGFALRVGDGRDSYRVQPNRQFTARHFVRETGIVGRFVLSPEGDMLVYRKPEDTP